MLMATSKEPNVTNLSDSEKRAIIWDFYRPRHTHAWNMLVLSWRALEASSETFELDFEYEYLWENFIIRLWLYRTTVRTLTHIDVVKIEAEAIIKNFDQCFLSDGKNALKAIRDMIEHFDDYAADKGHGPATRVSELDPWRTVGRDKFERGRFAIDRETAYAAAIVLRSEAKRVSDAFIARHKASD